MRTTRLFLSAFLIILLGSAAARPQLSFTLTPSVQAGFPGTTLSFTAMLRNTGSAELFLNGDSFTLVGPDLRLNDTKFFTNTPLSLLGGEAWTGAIFDVVIGAAAVPGGYGGSFTVRGGADGGALNEMATQNFQVVVDIPEPGTGGLLATGCCLTALLGSLTMTVRRRCRPRGYSSAGAATADPV